MNGIGILVALAIAGAVAYFYSTSAQASIDENAGGASSSSGTTWSPPAAAGPYLASIDAAERANGIPHNLQLRQLDIESAHFDPDVISGAKISATGDVGIAQFQPATAAELGVDPTDPYASIDAAARYLRSLYDQVGTWDGALAAYNWGIGNVLNHGAGAAPSSTQKYVQTILSTVGLA